jgi:hypothetical protein
MGLHQHQRISPGQLMGPQRLMIFAKDRQRLPHLDQFLGVEFAAPGFGREFQVSILNIGLGRDAEP